MRETRLHGSHRRPAGHASAGVAPTRILSKTKTRSGGPIIFESARQPSHTPRSHGRRRLLAFALPLLAALVLAACSGDGGPGAETPTTATPSSGETAPSATPGPTVDLATQALVSIVYGDGEGDLPSDQPAISTGDFDGDGLSDLAIGARFADPAAGADAGAVYLILGREDLPATVDLREGEEDVAITGPHPGANFGFAIAAADLNDDGVDDLAVGAAFAETDGGKTGAVYVFFGPLGAGSPEIAAADAGVVIAGESADGFLGDSLASGDVNSDGLPDLIIGATFETRRRSQSASVRGGAVHVFFGRGNWPPSLAAGDADVSIFGEDDLDELGDFVASGDVNGDGNDDIIATAEAADGPQNDRPTAAQVYVLFGGEDLRGEIDLGSDSADVLVYGAVSQDTLGFSLATGDLDGDGTDDLVMGARLAEGGGVTRAGVVYVLPGGDLPAEIDLAAPPDSVRAVHGAARGELLGSAVYVGDVNGDGRNELLAGARLASPSGRSRAGSVYVVSGLPEAGLRGAGQAASTTILGAAAEDGLGGNIRAADLNGDGRPELVLVAENAPGPGDSRPRAGRVYIINVH